MSLNGGTFTVAAGVTLSVPGTFIGSSLTLTSSSAGTMEMSGVNAYGGATNVNGGILGLAGPNNPTGSTLPAGTTLNINNGGTVRVDGVNALGGYGDNNIPSVIIHAGGLLTMSNGMTCHLNSLTLAGGTLSSTTSPSGTWGSWSFDGPVDATANSTINAYQMSLNGGTFTVAAGVTLSVPGTFIGSSLTLTSSSAGTMEMSGVNAYTGTTTVNGGTLQLGDGVANNGSVAGNIIDNSTLTFANPIAQTYSGVISGSGALHVDGPGTLALTGANTYTGGTTISGGTLVVGNSTVAPYLSVGGNPSVDLGMPYTLNILSSVSLIGWQINWGDGQTQSLAGNASSATHVYVSGLDNYTVTATATSASGTATAMVPVAVLADPAILAAVRQTLALPADAPLTTADWQRLTSLSVNSNKVHSLNGLQCATNLQSLTLVPSDFSVAGHLTDLSPLSTLTNLKSLTLQDCGLNDSSLSTFPGDLTGLQSLDLRYNGIDTVPSVVANLPSLSSLLLYGNPLAGNATQTWYQSLSGKLLTVDIAPNNPQSIIANIDPGNPGATYAALAAAFYNLPIEIYQYLVNTIQYQPYQGEMKGPLAVLETGAGNDWDTDSLLAALLQQTGIQATTYAWGSVSQNAVTVENWLAVKTPAAAYDALAVAGLNPVFLNSSFSRMFNDIRRHGVIHRVQPRLARSDGYAAGGNLVGNVLP